MTGFNYMSFQFPTLFRRDIRGNSIQKDLFSEAYKEDKAKS